MEEIKPQAELEISRRDFLNLQKSRAIELFANKLIRRLSPVAPIL
jgi:hypothetical protein